jgi:hypothetical protein
VKPSLPIIVPVVTFGLGFGAAWLAKPDPSPFLQPEATKADRASLSSDRRGSPQRGSAKGQEEIDALLTEMREYRSDQVRLAESIEAFGPSRIPELLAALARKAGLNGLAGEDETLLEHIVEYWYQQDRTAALDWVAALGNERDQRALLQELLNLETKQGLEGALALLDEFEGQFSEGLRVPTSLFRTAAARDVETLLQVCRATMGERASSVGITVDFVDGFDFEGALNGLAEAQSNLPEGYRFGAIPGSLLEEWAKRDPQAALDWVGLDKDVMFNSGIRTYIEGYREVASDAEMGAFLARMTEADGDYKVAWQTLNDLESEGVVREYFAQDQETVERHVDGLLRQSLRGGSSSHAATSATILTMVDAESRYRLFTASEDPLRITPSTRVRLAPVLERLGHTPSEVSEMLGSD